MTVTAGVPEQSGPVPSSDRLPPPPGYVTVQDFLATGLSYRRVDYWTRCGYLMAAQDRVGSGYKRLWPADELAVAVAIMRLIDVAGIDLRRAVSIARDRRPAEGSWEVHVLAPGLRIVASPELWSP